MLLRDIHSNLIDLYDCKEVCSPSLSQVNTGPQLNRLFESSFVRDESSDSNADVTVIPSQLRVTQQILSHW
jgi:hypothetical protein